MKSHIPFSRGFFILVLLCAFFIGCKDSSDGKMDSGVFPSQHSDTLTIDVGFPAKTKCFKHKGKTYVVFYDVVTYKRAKLYDEELNWVKSFSFDKFEELGLSFADMEMITPDSILLLTDYSTKVLISMNIKTSEHKTINLNSLCDYPEYDFPLEFNPSLFNGFKQGNDVAFGINASLPALLAQSGISELSQIEFFQKYDSINKALPFYVVVKDPFGQNPKTNFIEESTKFKRTFGNAYYNELNFTFIGEDELVRTSRYLDYFDVYNVQTNKTSSVTIKSKFTDISSPLRTWKALKTNPPGPGSQIFNDDLRKAGRVKNMLYDKVNKRFHVFLFYSEKRNPIKDPQVSPFIWQIYDDNFVLLSEREQAPTDLVIGSALGTEKYVYIPYYNEKTYDPFKAEFIRFSY